ncbi:MAG: GDP-mannose 4,6-dehydratase, partial [Mariprofundaceae bacterium]|nr:GDP-mannose 4,6-dehydratase [Mariprofundaceae bacterium]
GKRDGITVFGRDYDTQDGTCIRDYIHIVDLCEAHWLSMQYMLVSNKSHRYNLGNGQGFSVAQVIAACRHVSARNISVVEGKRRVGDPAVLVADSTLIQDTLGWIPKYNDLSVIIRHAWSWEKKQSE